MSDEDVWVDSLYRGFDALMRAGHFVAVDILLNEVDPSVLPVLVGLAYLSITAPAADRLKSREGYKARLRTHLLALRAADEVGAILHGL